jgi:hypothetical protein
MSEMVERVARAMARHNYPGGTATDIDEMWEGWAGEARAAVAEMREPTQQMVEAAKPLPVHLIEQRKDTPGYEMQMRAAAQADQMAAWSDWQTMIDAALAD